jgi:hypothetical protein
MHLPLAQYCPLGHTLPQEPQFALSAVDMHAPLHTTPLSQTHAPPEQRSPGRHALLQPPQCMVLVSRFAHSSPQTV